MHSLRTLACVSGVSLALVGSACGHGTGLGSATVQTTFAPAWTTIGHSVQARPIVATRFGAGTWRVLVVGGVHGNEYGTIVAARFAAYLAAHPAAVPAGVEIDVIRCLNPDGRALNTRANARNVDINRNFPTADWSSTLAAGDYSGELGLSGGSRPASEPETRTLLAYLQQGFSVVLSLHSAGGLLDYHGPGGAALAKRMSALCGLPVDHLAYQSYIAGSMGEYIPRRYHIPTITVELRDARLSSDLCQALLAAATPSGA